MSAENNSNITATLATEQESTMTTTTTTTTAAPATPATEQEQVVHTDNVTLPKATPWDASFLEAIKDRDFPEAFKTLVLAHFKERQLHPMLCWGHHSTKQLEEFISNQLPLDSALRAFQLDTWGSRSFIGRHFSPLFKARWESLKKSQEEEEMAEIERLNKLEEVKQAERDADKAQRKAEREAQREAEKAQRKAQREAQREAEKAPKKPWRNVPNLHLDRTELSTYTVEQLKALAVINATALLVQIDSTLSLKLVQTEDGLVMPESPAKPTQIMKGFGTAKKADLIKLLNWMGSGDMSMRPAGATSDLVKAVAQNYRPEEEKPEESLAEVMVIGKAERQESAKAKRRRRESIVQLEEAIKAFPAQADAIKPIKEMVSAGGDTPTHIDLEQVDRASKALEGNTLEQVSSQVGATYCLTLQVYPTNERTAHGDGNHAQVMKVALVPSVAWRQGASFLVNQFNNWIGLEQNQDLAKKLNAKPFKVEVDDFIFVQNKTDENGNESAIPELNRVLTKLGYLAVTPGFWLKKNHPYCAWIKSVFKTNLVVRGRARSIATTPYQAQLSFQLERDAEGNVIGVSNTPVFVADLTKYGHVGLDGSNIISKNLMGTGWTPGVVAQIRLHTNPYIAQSYGVQGKGLARAHNAWAVHTQSGWVIKTDFYAKKSIIDQDDNLSPAEKESAIKALKAEYLPAIILHYDNVKGAGSKELEKAVKGKTTLLNLNQWGMEDGYESALFGGVIAEDYRGQSTTSWQNGQLYSPEVLDANKAYIHKLLDTAFKKLAVSGESALSDVEGFDVGLRQLIAAQQASNHKWVTSVAFGANQKWPTFYCEQMDMPAGFVVAGSKIGGKADKLAITGQPQLYHQCLVVANRLSWDDVNAVIEHLDGEKVTLTELQVKWLAAWGKMGVSDDDILHRLRWMAGGFVPNGTESLIWVSTVDQKTMQRDSDGDRLLVLWDKDMIKLVEDHNKSIEALLKPHLEVDRKTALDGDQKYKDLANGDWGNPDIAEEANEYICAPNAGQGPTGELVNANSAVLNHFVWQQVNGTWQPESDKMHHILKLYGFMCLLIQCSIDRQKKVWAVPALCQWLALDLYSGEITSYETLAPGVEKYSFFIQTKSGDKSIREIPVRTGYADMFNRSIIKPWLAMMINLVNAKSTCLNDTTGASFQKVFKDVAQAFLDSSNNPGGFDWAAIAQAIGAQVSAEELKSKWVFPDELYSFKDQASLYVPVPKAAPGIKWLTTKATEVYSGWRKEKGISNYPSRQLFLKLSGLTADWMAKPNAHFGDDSSALDFVREFSSMMARSVAQNLASVANSEIKQGRGGDTAREALKEIRAALTVFDVYHPVSKLIKYAVGRDAKPANVSMACLGLIRMWTKSWLTSAATNSLIEYFSVLNLYGQIDANFDWSVQEETEATRSVKEEVTPIEVAKNVLRNLEVVCNEENKTLLMQMIDDVNSDVSLATLVEKNRLAAQLHEYSIAAEPTGAERILTEWLPALELAQDNIDMATERRELFLDDSIFQDFCGLVGDPSIVTERAFLDFAQRKILPVLSRKLLSLTKSQANLANQADTCMLNWYRLVANQAGWDATKLVNNLAGFTKLYLPHMLPRTREIVDLMTPFVQAYRTKVWILDMYGKVGSLGTSDPQVHNQRMVTMVEEAVFNMKHVFDPTSGTLRKEKTIKSRPEVAVSPALRAKFTWELLSEGLSHYGLHTTRRPAFIDTKDGKKMIVTRTDRWVYMDSKMPRNLDILNKACEQGLVIGHIFNPDWLKVMLESVKNQLNVPELSADEKVNLEAKKDVLEYALADVLSMYVIEDTSPRTHERQLLGSLAFPAWYGGRDKCFQHTPFDSYRTSAHRSVWRFIMSVMPLQAEFQDKAELYDRLTGCQTLNASNRRGFAVSENTDWVNALSTSSWGTSTANSGYSRAPRDFNTTPGDMFINGTWSKPNRSPAAENLGMLDIQVGNISFQMRTDAYVSNAGCTFQVSSRSREDSENWVENAPSGFGESKGIREMTIMAMRSNVVTGRINGLEVSNIVAQRIAELRYQDIKGCVVSEVDFEKFKTEAIIGCWGATNALDSIVVSKMSDDSTWGRFSAKTSTAWRDFAKGNNRSFKILPPVSSRFYQLLFAAKGN
jgi:hypothetical protein